MTIRVVVAEDQAMVRAGLAALLDATDDIHVVGEAADGDEVVHLARKLEPDVVLMDVRMPRLTASSRPDNRCQESCQRATTSPAS